MQAWQFFLLTFYMAVLQDLTPTARKAQAVISFIFAVTWAALELNK